MRVLIVGDVASLEEAQQKFGAAHTVLGIGPGESLQSDDVVFDFTIHDHPERVAVYQQSSSNIFLNTSFASLRSLGVDKGLFGFCGLPTLFNRPLLEVSCARPEEHAELSRVLFLLGTEYGLVADQAGLVAPRIIARIINEAYLALEGGTATKSDINLAMKLGTNYPFGPFEWCDRIGRHQVLRVLDAAYRESGDERYKPALSLQSA